MTLTYPWHASLAVCVALLAQCVVLGQTISDAEEGSVLGGVGGIKKKKSIGDITQKSVNCWLVATETGLVLEWSF